jgi:hypothetical protein
MSADISAPVTHTVLEACFEFVCHGAPTGGEEGLPLQPGQIERNAEGRATLLHFAPRRWLAPAPSGALRARLIDLENRGKGALIDVDGKWQQLRAADAGILESSLNVGAVLRNRDCAAAAVFDCPAILARDDAALDLWVASSYLDSFLSALAAR